MADDGIPFRQPLADRLHRPTAEEIQHTRAPIAFLWDRRIPAGKVTILAGAGGTGKSSFLVGLALARATGHPFLGVPTIPGATLFLSAEDSMTDYLRKVDAWRSLYPTLDAEKISRNVSIWEFIGEDFRIVSSRFGEVTANAARVDEIVVGVLSLDPRPDLIVIETASRFGAGDENANGAAAALIAACERLSEMTSAAILLMTHVGKAAARTATVDAYAPRGASALTDNARSVLVLSDIPRGTDSAARAAQERILGRHLDPGEDLLVLAAGKSNFAPRAGHVIVERIATPYGLTMKSIGGSRGASSQSAEEFKATISRVAADARTARQLQGERLRAIVVELSAAGEVVTARRLREVWADKVGIPVKRILEAADDAVRDGFLLETVGARGMKILTPKFENGVDFQVGTLKSGGDVSGGDLPTPQSSGGDVGSTSLRGVPTSPPESPNDISILDDATRKGVVPTRPHLKKPNGRASLADPVELQGISTPAGITDSTPKRVHPGDVSGGDAASPSGASPPTGSPPDEIPEIDPAIFGA